MIFEAEIVLVDEGLKIHLPRRRSSDSLRRTYYSWPLLPRSQAGSREPSKLDDTRLWKLWG